MKKLILLLVLIFSNINVKSQSYTNVIHSEGVCIITDNCVLTLDFSTYKNGVYFITIQKDDKTYKNKIVKTD